MLKENLLWGMTLSETGNGKLVKEPTFLGASLLFIAALIAGPVLFMGLGYLIAVFR
jgi:hypothetical protein